MKNFFFLLMIFAFAAISCGGDEDEVQKIDQVINLYVKNTAGKDLLNTTLPGTYYDIKLLDLNAERDFVPINSFSIRKNADTVNYIDYVAGAVRISADTLNPSNRTYYSDFTINLTKKIDSVNTDTDIDTIKIEYSWTPTLFQVSKFYYNGKLKFSKVDGEPNMITIIK